MKDWKEYKLGDVINLKRGYDLPSQNRSNGAIPIFSSSGITDYHDLAMKAGPGVITGRYGSIGKVFYTENPYWPLNTTLYVTDFKGNHPKFIYYLLIGFDFEKYSDKSAVPGLNRNDLHEEIVYIPPLSVQIAISTILSSLDDKIDLLHRQNKTLEQLAETLFRQWFVEEAEVSWPCFRVGDLEIFISDFVANGSFASLKENVTLIPDIEDYALFIRNTDLKSGFVNKVYVDKHSYEFLSKTKLYGGEVIISNVADVGSVFICPKFNKPMTLGNNVIMLNSNYNLFLYLYFNSPIGQSLIYGITSGSAQQKFNKTDFRNSEINIPSVDYLINFNKEVEIYFEKIENNNNQISTLTQLRDTLLPILMSGEVRVKM